MGNETQVLRDLSGASPLVNLCAFLDNHIDECVYGVDSFDGFDKKPLSFARCRKPFLVQSLVFASKSFVSL